MSDTITRNGIGYALTRLGFEKQQVGNLTVYRNSPKDATVVEPEGFLGSYGLSMFFNAARETVVGMGIADEQEFEQMLGSYRPVKRRRLSADNGVPTPYSGRRPQAVSRH